MIMRTFNIVKVIANNKNGRPPIEEYYMIQEKGKWKWKFIMDTSSDETHSPKFNTIDSAEKYIKDKMCNPPEYTILLSGTEQ
jgi:hypothetical protein